MALICDTSGVYSLYDADDAGYAATTRVVESEAGPLLLPVILLAEIDYLLHSRLRADAAAERLGLPRLLTQDQRHFRAIHPRGFDHFVLLPADMA